LVVHKFAQPLGLETEAGLLDVGDVLSTMFERARLVTAIRIIAVMILGGFALLTAAADLSRAFGRPDGDYGLRTTGTLVNGVEPGSPAARAGLRVGDSISLADNSPFIRRTALRGFAPAPGTPLRVIVLAPTRKSVVITAVPESSTNAPYLIARQIAYMLCFVLGAALLFLRPSISTWALFLYSLFAVGLAETVLTIRLHDSPLFWLEAALVVLLVAASVFGLVLLCVTLARLDSALRSSACMSGAAASLTGLSSAQCTKPKSR
jgi:hypothetical protein